MADNPNQFPFPANHHSLHRDTYLSHRPLNQQNPPLLQQHPTFYQRTQPFTFPSLNLNHPNPPPPPIPQYESVNPLFGHPLIPQSYSTPHLQYPTYAKIASHSISSFDPLHHRNQQKTSSHAPPNHASLQCSTISPGLPPFRTEDPLQKTHPQTLSGQEMKETTSNTSQVSHESSNVLNIGKRSNKIAENTCHRQLSIYEFTGDKCFTVTINMETFDWILNNIAKANTKVFGVFAPWRNGSNVHIMETVRNKFGCSMKISILANGKMNSIFVPVRDQQKGWCQFEAFLSKYRGCDHFDQQSKSCG
ncbi:hypothetical protein Syun_025715 [Stephania yunnanensis]|uniref:Uncharacterized protein n=1 Tax=Stephania yunnanensis TaxID=152371 RepID=A0AAP0HWE9_9MAGN